MAEYSKSVPKDPADSEQTLKAVLQVIVFQTKDGDEFLDYEIATDKVLLKFEAVD